MVKWGCLFRMLLATENREKERNRMKEENDICETRGQGDSGISIIK